MFVAASGASRLSVTASGVSLGLPSPALSYFVPTVTAYREYSALQATANISEIQATGAFYENDTRVPGTPEVALTLSSVLYAGRQALLVRYSAVFEQSESGTFVSFMDEVWNQTSSCSDHTDRVLGLKGNGSIQPVNLYCFTSRYVYSTPFVQVTLPLSLTLSENLTTADGYSLVTFGYSTSRSPSVVTDSVSIPGGATGARFVVGGLSPATTPYKVFYNDVELELASPIPGTSVNTTGTAAALSLACFEGGTWSLPVRAYDYALDNLSSAFGDTAYTDTSNPDHPVALVRPGELLQGLLWPLPVSGSYTVTQRYGTSFTVRVAMNYNSSQASRIPLPASRVTVNVSGTNYTLPFSGGTVSFTITPSRAMLYRVKVVYPTSIAFGSPNFTFTLDFARLLTQPNVSELKLVEAYPNGTQYSLVLGSTGGYLLLPPEGVGLLVGNQTLYQLNGTTRMGFAGWLANGSLVQGNLLFVNAPQTLVALFEREFLVTVTDPFANPSNYSEWVLQGAQLNISAPAVVYAQNNFVKYVFANWSVGGTSPNLTLTVNSPLDVNANYLVYYLVNISVENRVVVHGYYAAGSVIKFTAPGTVAGSWLYPVAFVGWEGNVVSSERTLTITVNSPILENAFYQESYANASALEAMGALLVGVAVATVLEIRELRRRT
jgi:hypothetical protein